MKKIIILLGMILAALLGYSQTGVLVYLEKENYSHKQTAILFSDSCSNELDVCCDTILLGNLTNNIWTKIGDNNYVFNTFGSLTEDKIVPINFNLTPDTGVAIIGVDESYGNLPPVRIIDHQLQLTTTLPYHFYGPSIPNRFSLLFEYPLSVEVINGCNYGYIIIDNDETNVSYMLIDGENNVSFYPNNTDTIFNLVDGNYTLILDDQISEEINFNVNNKLINAILNIPVTTLLSQDSFITPFLNIYTPYTTILWDFGDGTTLYNDINPIHQYVESGVFNLTVIISEGNCSRVFQSTITVELINGIELIHKNKIKTNYQNLGNFYSIDGKMVEEK